MARPGDVLENPQTGERIVFRLTAADTDGALLEFDQLWPRPGLRASEHVHPEMEERWEVLEGTARFRLAGREQTAGAGEVVVAAPGTPHLAWNPTSEPVRLRVQFRPALRWERFLEQLFALAQEGRCDADGTFDVEAIAPLMREFRSEIAPPPRPARVPRTG